MEVIENGKYVIKKACIEKELYKHEGFDYFGATAGVQLYFSLATLKKREPALKYLYLCNNHLSSDLLQTWMSVDFKSPEECSQRHLMISNVKAVHPTINNINVLHFLLNIDVYFPPDEIKNLLLDSLGEDHLREFAPMHPVVKQLGKLHTFLSKSMFHCITNTLGLGFEIFIDEGTSIFAQCTYLHWFLYFMFPVALFPVKGGHCALLIMKFMYGMQLSESLLQSLTEIFKDNQLPRSLPQHGFAQTAYPVYIADVKIPIYSYFLDKHLKALTTFSYSIKYQKMCFNQNGSPN